MPFGLKVEGHEDGGFEFLGQRLNELFRLFVAVGHRQIGTEGAKRLGAAVADRLIVGDTSNECLLALEKRQGRDVDHMRLRLSRRDTDESPMAYDAAIIG